MAAGPMRQRSPVCLMPEISIPQTFALNRSMPKPMMWLPGPSKDPIWAHIREYADYLNGVGEFGDKGDPDDGADAYDNRGA